MSRTRATRTAVLAVLTAFAVSSPLAGSVDAQPSGSATAPQLDDPDTVGDVRILTPGASVRAAVRRSIDIEHVRATERGNGVRFSVEVRRYLERPRVDQVVLIDLTPVAADPTGFEVVHIGWSPQRARWRAFVSALGADPGEGRSCRPARLVAQPRTDVLAIDVPARCLPVGASEVEVTTYTGTLGTDAPRYSRDRLAVGPRQ